MAFPTRSRRQDGEEDGRFSQFTPGQLGSFAVIGGILILAVALLFTSYHTVKPGQAAVIKNNITGQETVQTMEGIILHLPWGMTDVYVLDMTQQSLVMAGEDSVVIKTREGANVDAVVEVTFNLLPTHAAQIVRGIGLGRSGADLSKVSDCVLSYVRAKVRDSIGELNLEELARPAERTARVEETRKRLNEVLLQYGVEIQTVSATDWDYDDRYEEMIRKRKEADQIFVNQAAGQETNRKKQETSIAEQNRMRSNAIAEATGDAQKEVIGKDAWSVEQRASAEGSAYKTRKEADAMFIRLANEAAGLEAELTRRAQGIQVLAEAYTKGGIGLVKEALADKLKGARIVGRPFSNDSNPQRVQIETVVPAAQGPK